jgi:thiol-disulfide isomerase/thioredoxin
VTSIDSPLPAPPPGPPAAARKPRRIFLLVGVVVAAALGIGLFTSIGAPKKSGVPQPGDQVPSFTAARVNGAGTVRVNAKVGRSDRPTVLLFFGQWCSICRTELPSLAATVRSQDAAGGPLARIRVVGVDSEDPLSVAQSFVASSGVTFPVAYDQDAAIMNGKFFFDGDPYAVFVNGNGIIDKVIPSRISPAAFRSDERALIPSGS